MDIVVGNSWLRTEIFPAMDMAGREHLVVIVKSTWTLPQPGQRVRPLVAEPIIYTDSYYGDPGLSPLIYPADIVRFKPQCDVIFDSCAHSPDGRPHEMLVVQAQVGDWEKRIRVWGRRVWKHSLIDYTPSKPEPFLSMPLHLGLAFGGMHDDTSLNNNYHAINPEGIGWSLNDDSKKIKGFPVPCLESIDENIKSPFGNYTPIGLNSISVNHPHRQQYSGTYDDYWRKNVFPFLPDDFDERFHQGAPVDQRINYPQGGELVKLINLLPDYSNLQFNLPPLNTLQLRILRKDYSIETPKLNVDTLFFETEKRKFSVVWRGSVPIRRRIHEFSTIAIGPIDEQWWRARSLGLDENECTGCRAPMKQAA